VLRSARVKKKQEELLAAEASRREGVSQAFADSLAKMQRDRALSKQQGTGQ